MAAPLQLKLVYFPLPARAFVTRTCLRASGHAFEDVRVTFPEWRGGYDKSSLPLGQLPVLFVNGVPHSQSIPISQYAAKLAGLFPADPLAELRACEAVFIVDELWNKIGHVPNDKEKREAYGLETAPKYLKALAGLLGTDKFFGGSPTPGWADLWLYAYVSLFTSGFFDHIPLDFVEKAAPTIAALSSAVKASELYAKHGNSE